LADKMLAQEEHRVFCVRDKDNEARLMKLRNISW